MAFARFAKALPPSLSLAGQTAIVTGASSGIGRQSVSESVENSCCDYC